MERPPAVAVGLPDRAGMTASAPPCASRIACASVGALAARPIILASNVFMSSRLQLQRLMHTPPHVFTRFSGIRAGVFGHLVDAETIQRALPQSPSITCRRVSFDQQPHTLDDWPSLDLGDIYGGWTLLLRLRLPRPMSLAVRSRFVHSGARKIESHSASSHGCAQVKRAGVTPNDPSATRQEGGSLHQCRPSSAIPYASQTERGQPILNGAGSFAVGMAADQNHIPFATRIE